MAYKRKSSGYQREMAPPPQPKGMPEDQKVLVWRLRPDIFFKEVLGMMPTNQQEEALTIVAKLCELKYARSIGRRLQGEDDEMSQKLGISISSGQGSGKDSLVAGLMLWWLRCWAYSEGRVTAPTANQLDDNLWKEVRMWLRKSKDDPTDPAMSLRNLIEVQADKVFRKDAKGEWFFSKRTTNAKASADEQGETLAGAHKEYLMYVVDEASGVPDGVYKPLEGAMSGRVNFAILISNPTRGTGYFARSQSSDRKFWIALRWDCEESNLDEITGSTGLKDYCARQASKYGKDSNTYRMRVKGLLPIADQYTLIPQDWIEAAIERELEPLDTSPEIAGIDVAAGGSNKTVLTFRRGNKVLKQHEFDQDKSEILANNLVFYLKDPMPAATAVDRIGWGWGVIGLLRDRGVKNVISYDSSEKARKENEFANRRVEDYWKLRTLFEEGRISIPKDDDLVGQLGALRLKEPDNKGRMQMKSKKEMLADGVESPDKADSLCICFSVRDEAYIVDAEEDEDERLDRRRKRRQEKNDDDRGWMAA